MSDKVGKEFGRRPSLLRRLATAGRLLRLHLKGKQFVKLDYRVNPQCRWGHGEPPHERLYELLNGRREQYAALLREFAAFADELAEVPVARPDDERMPFWANTYLPPLDAAALYCLLCIGRPARFVEAGSGNSTKFARRAIERHGLPTRITSIDPLPRAEVDSLCDEVIRSSLEQADLGVYDGLQPGDVVYVDGSHRCLQNSDVTVLFLEVLRRLAPGVLVHVHDVHLPADYPPRWRERFYSEQYVLAAYMLGRGEAFETVLPNAFIAVDDELRALAETVLAGVDVPDAAATGVSLWFRTGPGGGGVEGV